MKISLIIPVYNVRKYLRKALDSAVCQSWADYEVVLVDDGSTDGSFDVCCEYSRLNSRIQFVSKKNGGLMSAWKMGLEMSSGEYVAFLDSDDWVDEHYLKQMAEVAEKEDADVVCCSYLREYSEYHVLEREKIPAGVYNKEEIRKRIFPYLINNGEYLGRGISPHRWGKLIRKTVIEKNLCWCNEELTFGEDLNILFPVMLDCGKLVIMNDQQGLYHYRQNPLSILRAYKIDMFKQIRRLYQRLLQISRVKRQYDFSEQIRRDAFCLFMEYVKNETKQRGNFCDIAHDILRNYEKMQKDFGGIYLQPLCLKQSDRVLAFCLEQQFFTGLCSWLFLYRQAKCITGGMDWNYYKKSKKRISSVRVLMVGPDLSVKGGIRTVAAQCLAWQRWKNVELRYIPVYVEKTFLYKILFFLKGCLQIWLFCFTKQVDVLHLHMAERGSFYRKALIQAVCRMTKVKVVLHHHGAEFLDFYDRSRSWKRAWIYSTIKKAHVNLVLGEYQRGQMKKRFPTASFQIQYNVVTVPDANNYRIDATGILFVGRMGKRKGIYDLLKAVSECENRLEKNIKLYLCGDGETKKVQETVNRLGIQDRIEYIGWVSQDRMKRIYQDTMMMILPSYHEGLPMALLEAMAQGIPCIASNTDAVPELIEDGQSGILVEPGNVAEIRQALLYLATNPQARERIGESGYRRVKNKFRLEKGMKGLQEAWEDIIKKEP